MNIEVENLKPNFETPENGCDPTRVMSRKHPGLTICQANVFEWIVDYITMYGFSPTMAEIAFAFGWKSTFAAKDIIAKLKDKGFLVETMSKRARGLIVSPHKAKCFVRVLNGVIYCGLVPKEMNAETARKIGEKFVQAAKICEREMEEAAKAKAAREIEEDEE